MTKHLRICIYIYSNSHTFARSLHNATRAINYRFAVVFCFRLAFHAPKCDFWVFIQSKIFLSKRK